MSKANTKKDVAADSEQFADLYRDIRGQFTKAAGKLHKVVLKHISMRGRDGGGDSDVSQWEADHFEGKEPGEFAQEVVTDILEDAKIFPPVTQRYGLFFWHKNTTTHTHRLFIMVKGGGPDDNGDVFSSEEPDDRGRTSQLMRHDEAYTRLNLQSIHNTMSSKDKQIERYEGMLEKLMGQFVPVLGMVQDIMDRSVERDFNIDRKKKMYALLDMLGEKGMQVGPYILAHALKEKKPELSQMILKAVAHPADDIVKLFMTEIEANPDKAGQIFGAVQQLPNGQAIIQALAQLHQQQKVQAAQEAAKAEEKKKQQNGVSDTNSDS
jgi:hypothetical protein